MRNVFFLIVFAFLFFGKINAQELIRPDLPALDSSYLNDSLLIPDLQITNQMLPLNDFAFSLETASIKLPKFDFNQHLLNMKQDYNYYIFNPEGETNINIPFAFMPFTNSAAIFSQAAYKISDRFTFGGNSFGAKSIFSSPFPNQGVNNFDVRGASMFLEYKVSDKVKIQTRVSVSNQRH